MQEEQARLFQGLSLQERTNLNPALSKLWVRCEKGERFRAGFLHSGDEATTDLDTLASTEDQTQTAC